MNVKFAFLTIGVITLAGNMVLAAKLWPVIISMFFTSIKIYVALSMFLNQFFS